MKNNAFNIIDVFVFLGSGIMIGIFVGFLWGANTKPAREITASASTSSASSSDITQAHKGSLKGAKGIEIDLKNGAKIKVNDAETLDFESLFKLTESAKSQSNLNLKLTENDVLAPYRVTLGLDFNIKDLFKHMQISQMYVLGFGVRLADWPAWVETQYKPATGDTRLTYSQEFGK